MSEPKLLKDLLPEAMRKIKKRMEKKPTCVDCFWFRKDYRDYKVKFKKLFGEYVAICNRYPENIMRGTLEPVCGEFKEKEK